MTAFFAALSWLGTQTAYASHSRVKHLHHTHHSAEDIPVYDFNHSDDVASFIDYMVNRHGFARDALQSIFNRIQFSAKAVQLIKPATSPKFKNWEAYRARFIEPVRIKAGVNFWNTYAEALSRAEKDFGVPAEIIVGIIGVETIYGKNTGSFRVVDVLATLGFAYPDIPNKTARMAYFRSELEHSLLFARESGIDPFSLTGSYAGAIGLPQFMPSSIRHYGFDFDVNGKIDLRNSPEDAIGSVANFLLQHGWKTGEPLVFPAIVTSEHPETMLTTELNATYTPKQLSKVATIRPDPTFPALSDDSTLLGLIDLQNGPNPTEYWLATQNFFAITKYNRSYFYAMSVIELGKAICRARKEREEKQEEKNNTRC